MRKDADYLNVPEAFTVQVEKPMMHYPAAVVEYWHARVEEKRREHIGGPVKIFSILEYGEYVYYISGWVRRKPIDVRNS